MRLLIGAQSVSLAESRHTSDLRKLTVYLNKLYLKKMSQWVAYP